MKLLGFSIFFIQLLQSLALPFIIYQHFNGTDWVSAKNNQNKTIGDAQTVERKIWWPLIWPTVEESVHSLQVSPRAQFYNFHTRHMNYCVTGYRYNLGTCKRNITDPFLMVKDVLNWMEKRYWNYTTLNYIDIHQMESNPEMKCHWDFQFINEQRSWRGLTTAGIIQINYYQISSADGLYSTIAHEIGHSLGLGDAYPEKTIMSWFFPDRQQLIFPRDVRALLEIQRDLRNGVLKGISYYSIPATTILSRSIGNSNTLPDSTKFIFMPLNTMNQIREITTEIKKAVKRLTFYFE